MNTPTVDQTQSDLAALESFVVDNDDLLELEERIGRFNIFDALRVDRAEIRHSNFLAWLLDPAESHGCADLFLKAILMDLLRQMPPNARPLSPVELDGITLADIEIRREWKNIDLLIISRNPDFVIAIENKIGSKEHSNQLERYKKIVSENFAEQHSAYVFLTPEGDEPSDEDWNIYSYADIHRVLTRVRRTNHASIGNDVLTFLDHYTRLIGSRLMDDPKIDELCNRIYQNHRQAIDLIIDRVGSPASQVIEAISDLVEADDGRWHIERKLPNRIVFVPKQWLSVFPPINARKTFHPNAWLVLSLIANDKNMLVCRARGWPTTDQELRNKILSELAGLKSKSSYGFRLNSETSLDKNYLGLGRDQILKWNEDELPDEALLESKVRAFLDTLHKRLDPVPDLVRTICANHQQ